LDLVTVLRRGRTVDAWSFVCLSDLAVGRPPAVALPPVQADERDHAARCRRARHEHRGAALLQRRRRRLLLLLHSIAVFSASLRENLRLWNEDISDDLIVAALAKAQLGFASGCFHKVLTPC
jgi:hypothetical protein